MGELDLVSIVGWCPDCYWFSLVFVLCFWCVFIRLSVGLALDGVCRFLLDVYLILLRLCFGFLVRLVLDVVLCDAW